MNWAWTSLVWVGFTDLYVRHVRDGHLDGLADCLSSVRPGLPERGLKAVCTCNDHGLSRHRSRRARHRRRRRRAARGDRSVGRRASRSAVITKSLLGKAHTVMAEGGMAAAHGQRRRPRQLARPLRRHDARRPVPEQLADGRAPRQGSARSRARARGVGRGVRSHRRTAASSSATSAAIAIRGSRTSAIAPASR